LVADSDGRREFKHKRVLDLGIVRAYGAHVSVRPGNVTDATEM
jgi:hypothetical protein